MSETSTPAAGTITAQFGELRTVLETKHKEFVSLVETANAEIAKTGKLSTETKERMEEVGKKAIELDKRLALIEQKTLKPDLGDANVQHADTPGGLMIKSQSYKDLLEGRTTRARIQIKNTILSSTAPNLPVGSMQIPPQYAAAIPTPQLPITVRDLLATGRTTSNLIEYVRAKTWTNRAAIVPEGTQKPESDLMFELVSSPVVTIAHFIMASKQVLADAPMLQSYIDTLLIYGLKREEEDEIINGDGTAGHLSGLLHNATAMGVPVQGNTTIDQIGVAAAQIMASGYQPNGVVMNPADWMGLMTAKDVTGRYLFGNPTSLTPVPVWGMRAVPSFAMAAGNFLVGDFATGAQIWDREDANVVASTEDRDNFIKNLVTLLAEERMALAVYVPLAFVKGIVIPPTGGALSAPLGTNGNGKRA